MKCIVTKKILIRRLNYLVFFRYDELSTKLSICCTQKKGIKRKKVSFGEGLVLVIHSLTKDNICSLCIKRHDKGLKVPCTLDIL